MSDSRDAVLQRAGARLTAEGWVCRGCGLPVEHGSEATEAHGVPTLFFSMGEEKGTVLAYCQRRIGKVVDMAKLSVARRRWTLDKVEESFALPDYLRGAVRTELRPTAKPSIKTVTMWYLEVRQTLRHFAEVNPPRPPLSKRAEEAAKLTLARNRW